eukprot:3284257-Amphidinium_carterae.1
MERVSLGQTWNRFGIGTTLQKHTKQECAHSAFGGLKGQLSCAECTTFGRTSRLSTGCTNLSRVTGDHCC